MDRKRQRTAEGAVATAGDDDRTPPTPRDRACEAAPQFVTPARECITLRHFSRDDRLLSEDKPLFTHQLFPGEKVFGYVAPRITIDYREPSMVVRVAFAHSGVLDAGAGGVQPDDIAACLRLALPDGYVDSLPGGSLPPAPGAWFPADADGNATVDSGMSSRWLPPGEPVLAYTPAAARAAAPSVATATAASTADAPTPAAELEARSVEQRRPRFCLYRYRLDTPALQAYHDRMATLAMWHIETASPVNCRDSKWSVYGLWQEEQPRVAAGEVGGSASTAASPSAASTSATVDAPTDPLAPMPRDHSPRFVGYCTTYTFTNPFASARPLVKRRKPQQLPVTAPDSAGGASSASNSGGFGSDSSSATAAASSKDIVRLAQLLIAPAFQRQGHGHRVLDAIIGHVYASGAAQFTVESPCEGMARLRDCHDTRRAVEARVFAGLPGWEAWAPVLAADDHSVTFALHPCPAAVNLPSLDGGAASTAAVPAASSDSSEAGATGGAGASAAASDGRPVDVPAAALIRELPLATLRSARELLRITDAQMHRAYEAMLLSRIDASDEEQLKRFRIMVKKRLLAGDEELQAADDEARKAVLAELWDEALAAYTAVGRRLGLLPR